MPRPPSSKSFRVFKLSSPNGKREWKIEGRPTGKRERYYFVTEKEAKNAARNLNDQIAAFGTKTSLTDSQRVMAAECLEMLPMLKASTRRCTSTGIIWTGKPAPSL
jgi:hypothetical protein